MAFDVGQALLSFTAGAIGFLSPCALPLLPTYVVYYLNLGEEASSKGQSFRTLTFILATLAGFMTVFASLGVIPSLAFQVIPLSSSILTPVIGIGMIIIGVIYATSDLFSRFTHTGLTPPRARSSISFYVFGIAYALASLSCSFPVFLLVVLSSALSSGFQNSLILFILYALGAGSILALFTLTLSISRDFLHARLMRAMPHMRKIGAAVLIISGLYILSSILIQ